MTAPWYMAVIESAIRDSATSYGIKNIYDAGIADGCTPDASSGHAADPETHWEEFIQHAAGNAAQQIMLTIARKELSKP